MLICTGRQRTGAMVSQKGDGQGAGRSGSEAQLHSQPDHRLPGSLLGPGPGLQPCLIPDVAAQGKCDHDAVDVIPLPFPEKRIPLGFLARPSHTHPGPVVTGLAGVAGRPRQAIAVAAHALHFVDGPLLGYRHRPGQPEDDVVPAADTISVHRTRSFRTLNTSSEVGGLLRGE